MHQQLTGRTVMHAVRLCSHMIVHVCHHPATCTGSRDHLCVPAGQSRDRVAGPVHCHCSSAPPRLSAGLSAGRPSIGAQRWRWAAAAAAPGRGSARSRQPGRQPAPPWRRPGQQRPGCRTAAGRRAACCSAGLRCRGPAAGARGGAPVGACQRGSAGARGGAGPCAQLESGGVDEV